MPASALGVMRERHSVLDVSRVAAAVCTVPRAVSRTAAIAGGVLPGCYRAAGGCMTGACCKLRTGRAAVWGFEVIRGAPRGVGDSPAALVTWDAGM